MMEQLNNSIDQIPVEELERAIVDIGAGMRKLNNSRLTERAICVLLNDVTGLPMSKIRQVLHGLENLETRYLKPKLKDKKTVK